MLLHFWLGYDPPFADGRYARSFLLTETDENDLTYFLLHHLKVILRAIDELYAHVDRKAREVRAAERMSATPAG